MAKVHVDPDKLKEFANSLQRYSQELKSSSERIKSQFKQLDDTWQVGLAPFFGPRAKVEIMGIINLPSTWGGISPASCAA